MAKRIVGWFDREELKHVYEGLYADNEASRRYAIGRVAVWKARVMNKLPVAVECTTELVIGQLRDHQVSKDGCLQAYSREVRLQYAVALIRFVNLITESKQMGQYAQPIHKLAELQGLPSWLVELRHNATHAGLPALPLLRKAAQEALLWLQTAYWEQQVSNVEKNSFSEGSIADLLVDYMQQMFSHITNENFKKKRQRSEPIRQILWKIQSKLQSNKTRDIVLTTLCSTGYLDVTQEQIEALDIQEDEISETTVPTILIDLWRPILEMIESCDCLELLLAHLVSKVPEHAEKEDTSDFSWNCAWMCALMTAVSSEHEMKEAWGVSDLIMSPQRISTNALLKVILSQPSVNSALLLDHFVECFPDFFSDKSKMEIRRLLQIMTVDPKGVEDTKENAHFQQKATSLCTVEQLRELREGYRDEMETDKAEEPQQQPYQSTWCLDTSHDWSCHLLGTFPTCSMTYTSLTLSDIVDDIKSQTNFRSAAMTESKVANVAVEGIYTSADATPTERELIIDKSNIQLLW